MNEFKEPLLESPATQLHQQYDKIAQDFEKINAYYTLLKSQNDWVHKNGKKGVTVQKDENGNDLLTSVKKLDKKKELDIYVKRANNFHGVLKDAKKGD